MADFQIYISFQMKQGSKRLPKVSSWQPLHLLYFSSAFSAHQHRVCYVYGTEECFSGVNEGAPWPLKSQEAEGGISVG